MLRKRIFSVPFSVDYSFCIQLFKTARVFAIIVLLAAVYGKIDIIMLSKMKNTTEVGLYSAAFRFLLVTQMILSSFGASLYPVLSKLYKSSLIEFKRTCSKWIHTLLGYTFPVVVLVGILANNFILLLFKEDFSGSIKVLQILIWTVIPFTFVTVADFILLTTHNQKVDMMINLCAVCANIILNVILIPPYGAVGAATATLISMIIYLVVQYNFLSRYVIKFNLLYIFGKPLVASIVMVVVFHFLEPVNRILAIAGSILFYVVVFKGLKDYLGDANTKHEEEEEGWI